MLTHLARYALLPAVYCLVSCDGDQPVDPGVVPPTPAPKPAPTIEPGEPAVADDIARLAEEDGFVVGEGLFWFSTFEHCCDAGANCLGNNPSTPYGMVALPPAPDATVWDVDTFWMWGSLPRADVSRSFRMRPDEAYVWIGTAPPRSKYWSYRSSIATRADLFGQRELVLGSLGASTNQLTIAADRGVSPDEIWGTEVAFVTSSDDAIENMVDAWLVAAGIPADHIHHDRMSSTDAIFGLEEADDTFMNIMRVAVPDDPAAMAAWQADPPVRVLRFTPPSPFSQLPMGRTPLPDRGSGEDESAFLEALSLLDQAVGEMWPESEPTRLESFAGFTETFDCINDLSCIGDIRDRYATRILSTSLPEADSFVVVTGINHERSGRAVYSNFAVMTFDNRMGVLAVDSAQMVGSARAWLGDDHPQVDDLFAWVLARDCSAFDVPCLEVPETCPYPERTELFYITSRMYLDPATGAAPGDGEVEPDHVWEFRP